MNRATSPRAKITPRTIKTTFAVELFFGAVWTDAVDTFGVSELSISGCGPISGAGISAVDSESPFLSGTGV